MLIVLFKFEDERDVKEDFIDVLFLFDNVVFELLFCFFFDVVDWFIVCVICVFIVFIYCCIKVLFGG